MQIADISGLPVSISCITDEQPVFIPGLQISVGIGQEFQPLNSYFSRVRYFIGQSKNHEAGVVYKGAELFILIPMDCFHIVLWRILTHYHSAVIPSKNHHTQFIAYLIPCLVIRYSDDINIQAFKEFYILVSELPASLDFGRNPSSRGIDGYPSEKNRISVYQYPAF